MIKLIVGLGNPGKDYQTHRHNAGFWFVDSLATKFDVQFTAKSKSSGICPINQSLTAPPTIQTPPLFVAILFRISIKSFGKCWIKFLVFGGQVMPTKSASRPFISRLKLSPPFSL